MPAKTDNLVLEHLRAIRSKQDNHDDRLKEILMRLNSIESGIASVKREGAAHYSESVEQQHRIDRLVERIERIEKRLEIVDI